MRLPIVLCALCLIPATPAAGVEHVTLRHNGKELSVEGRLLVEAQDGGVMVLGRDGVIWTVEPKELVRRTHDDAPFEPLSAEQLSKQLLAELPKGFNVHRTPHYLIFYSTSKEYAQWCGSLFERLYNAFVAFWTRKGFKLFEPEFPLVAILFADRPSYEAHARGEVGEGAQSMIGYFSLKTNRMTMGDLTGAAWLGGGRRTSASSQVARILSQPEAERMVATIVHEATHQIAFNCGLHARFSDCPPWFSEGIAIYFETPDLRNTRGWGTVGLVNRPRLAQFRDYLARRPSDSLVTLLTDDKRFRDPKTGLDAYAEAWALTFYLIRRQPDKYVAYLEALSAKKPLVWDDPETRLQEFKRAFGDDLKRLDSDFVQYTLRLK